jgi:hypothetical protein
MIRLDLARARTLVDEALSLRRLTSTGADQGQDGVASLVRPFVAAAFVHRNLLERQ